MKRLFKKPEKQAANHMSTKWINTTQTMKAAIQKTKN